MAVLAIFTGNTSQKHFEELKLKLNNYTWTEEKPYQAPEYLMGSTFLTTPPLNANGSTSANTDSDN